MKKQQEFVAKSESAAIEEALRVFGVTIDRIEYRNLGKCGLFGTKVKVLVSVKQTPGEIAQEFLEELLGLMKVPAIVNLQETGDESVLNIVGDGIEGIFGRRGEIIEALQYLSSLVANTEDGDYHRIVIDGEVEGGSYREERLKRLERLADDKAAKAVAEGHRIRLDPMNPFERRVIHTHLQANPDVTTHSEGEEPNRYLVIVPNNERPRRDRGERRGGDRGHDGHGGRGDRRYGDRGHGRRDDRGHGDRGRGGYRERRPGGDKPQHAQATFIGTIVPSDQRVEEEKPSDEE